MRPQHLRTCTGLLGSLATSLPTRWAPCECAVRSWQGCARLDGVGRWQRPRARVVCLGWPRGCFARAAAAAPHACCRRSGMAAFSTAGCRTRPHRYACQIYQHAQAQLPQLEEQIAAGDFKPLKVCVSCVCVCVCVCACVSCAWCVCVGGQGGGHEKCIGACAVLGTLHAPTTS
jgi:hypothetical protein